MSPAQPARACRWRFNTSAAMIRCGCSGLEGLEEVRPTSPIARQATDIRHLPWLGRLSRCLLMHTARRGAASLALAGSQLAACQGCHWMAGPSGSSPHRLHAAAAAAQERWSDNAATHGHTIPNRSETAYTTHSHTQCHTTTL